MIKFRKSMLLFMAIFSTAMTTLLLGQTARAFDANNLMDDGVFTNSTSMNPQQIDIFLNGFPGSCLSQTNLPSGTPDPLGWSAAKGKYDFSTTNVSVGKAIFDAAQLYHVNPQVILATLQKEQSLVTGGSTGCHLNSPDPATATPMTDQCGSGTRNCTSACPFSYGGGCMNIAMGYGCPSYCDVNDEGFSMQLTLGTWLLRFGQQRAYGNLTGYTGYESGDENWTYYGIMTAGQRKASASAPLLTYSGSGTLADGSTVTVANGATSSLYNFTPYQSGNSKFVTIFQNWFGSPYMLLTWDLVNQFAYTDSSMTTPVDLGKLGPGERYYIGFSLKNTGNVTWSRTGATPLDLGTASPRDRASPFCDVSWSNPSPSCNRPTALREWTVAPGQIGSFGFYITAPNATGTYNEIYAPVMEGTAWMDSHTVSFPMIVYPASYTWSMMGQAIYLDDSKRTFADPAHLVAGQHYYMVISAKNTGNMLWKKGGSTPISLGSGTVWHPDENSTLCDTTSWLSCSRPASLHEWSVAPNQVGSFEFWIKIPPSGTSYAANFSPVVENTTWMTPPYYFAGTIIPATYSWSLINQFAFTDSTKTTPVNMGQLVAGQRYYIGFSLKNNGNTIWHQNTSNPFGVGPATPSQVDLVGKYCDTTTWPGGASCKRAAYLHEFTVAPGQVGSFEYWITAPPAGSYTGANADTYAPLMEGITWMNDHTVSFPSITH